MGDLAHTVRQIQFMVRQPVAKDGGIEAYQAYLNAFVQKLIKYNTFHTPSACKSIKYHCARHWGAHRQQLGCAAMEYSLERALGDHFSRFWKLTNHGMHGSGKDMQLAAIVHRHSVVADLCYHAKLECNLRQGKDFADTSAANLDDSFDSVSLRGKLFPVFRNHTSKFPYENGRVAGIFMHKLRANEARLLFPVTLSDTMRMPLQNRCVEKGKKARVEVLTLRARMNFFGKRRFDNVKLLVEMEPLPDGRRHDICYGRCVAFFSDCSSRHYVGVHWYVKVGTQHLDLKSRLQKVTAMTPNEYASYDILPVEAILNGALLVQDRGMKRRPQDAPQYWVRQSPREYNQLLHFYGERPFVPGESQLSRDRIL